MTESKYFSKDYQTARDRFRHAAVDAGGRLESLPLTAKGPDGKALTIDIGWFGTDRPRTVLLHSSGLHGVEGFAGSAIQLKLLERLPVVADDMAVVLVHILNPYGMAWLRRCNERNVDLNRNFLAEDETYEGRPDGYDALYAFLNPSYLRSVDLFVLHAGWLVFRHGMATLKRATVAGQYDYPEGLFFGGKQLQQEALLYEGFLRRRLGRAEEVFAIDVHTGLGPSGEDTVLVADTESDRVRQWIGPRVESLVAGEGNVAYRVSGGLHDWVPRILNQATVTFMGQEFGTYGPIRVLGALRKENCVHNYGDRSLDSPYKTRLKDVFCPDEPIWREKVLRRGKELFDQVVGIATGPESAG